MAKFENVTQDRYDQFKIYLISHFNVVFEESQDPNIVELFHVHTKVETVHGAYTTTQMVEINSKENARIFKEIRDKLEEIAGRPETKDKESGGFLKNTMVFYSHISKCDSCKKKLAEIWSHASGES